MQPQARLLVDGAPLPGASTDYARPTPTLAFDGPILTNGWVVTLPAAGRCGADPGWLVLELSHAPTASDTASGDWTAFVLPHWTIRRIVRAKAAGIGGSSSSGGGGGGGERSGGVRGEELEVEYDLRPTWQWALHHVGIYGHYGTALAWAAAGGARGICRGAARSLAVAHAVQTAPPAATPFSRTRCDDNVYQHVEAARSTAMR